jgi:hypothetical protein
MLAAHSALCLRYTAFLSGKEYVIVSSQQQSGLEKGYKIPIIFTGIKVSGTKEL